MNCIPQIPDSACNGLTVSATESYTEPSLDVMMQELSTELSVAFLLSGIVGHLFFAPAPIREVRCVA